MRRLVTGILLVLLLELLHLWTEVSAGPELIIYKEVGETVVLNPGVDSDAITCITWKIGLDLAVEWNSASFSYRQFQDKAEFNASSGELTIRNLSESDGGTYTSQINNNNNVVTTIHLRVVPPVPTPTVLVHCEINYCVFTCDANTTGSDDLQYYWRSEEQTLGSGKSHIIQKDERRSWFSCSLDNFVSRKSSEKVPNPFTNRRRGFILIPIVACILVLWVIIVRLCCNLRSWRSKEMSSLSSSTVEM